MGVATDGGYESGACVGHSTANGEGVPAHH